MISATAVYRSAPGRPTPSPRVILALAATIFVLPGCRHAEPVPRHAIAGTPLESVARAYDAAVERALSHPEISWHSGWVGNLFVNGLGDGHRGLCHHWQVYVHSAIKATADRAGLATVGIIVNWSQPPEHNAVIVYDPNRLSTRDLLPRRTPQQLARTGPRAAWVLDPWHAGRADIFTLDDWLFMYPGSQRPPDLVSLPERVRLPRPTALPPSTPHDHAPSAVATSSPPAPAVVTKPAPSAFVPARADRPDGGSPSSRDERPAP